MRKDKKRTGGDNDPAYYVFMAVCGFVVAFIVLVAVLLTALLVG